MEVRAIRQNEREECLALWRTVFGDDDAYFRRYFEGDVEWLPYYTQVAVEDGKLVSAVHICKRTVACGEFRLTMGGIANVATLDEFRGKGYNTACLKAAIGVMEADAMDFSLLFTGIPPYYRKQGYVSLPFQTVQGAIRADFAPSPTPYVVRAATGDDLDAIRAIYDAYNRTRPIAVQRYPAYWRDWMTLTPEELTETFLVSVDSGGQIVGYLTLGTDDEGDLDAEPGEVFVMELGLLGGESERADIARSLLSVVAVRRRSVGGRLHMNIALDGAVLAALAEIFGTTGEPTGNGLAAQWIPQDGGMARLLHRDNLLRSFVMEWNERWRMAGRPAGTLDFATPYGTARLDATGPLLRVAAPESEKREGNARDGGELAAVLSQETLFGLLFGLLSPEQATTDVTLHPLIVALFPRRAPVYWNADGF